MGSNFIHKENDLKNKRYVTNKASKLLLSTLVGTAAITVGVGHDVASAEVATPNQSPTTSAIPAQTVIKGQTITLDLNDYFSDPEGATLTYQLSYLPPAVFTHSLNGSILTLTAKSKGSTMIIINASDGLAYISNTIDYYVKNSAPLKPTLTVPESQFEYGEQHIITFNSTDPDADLIIYTLEATYDDGETWTQIYQGPNTSFTYTVPTDISQVNFRVEASDFVDGTASNGYQTGINKSVREVMYYWNKYINTDTDTKGSYIETLQGGYSAFTEDIKNADGYWYERGQRVLAADTTSPIIVGTEQGNFGRTSKVDVTVHDFSAISTLKFAQGNQDISYFTTDGIDITTSFTATANGDYTLYAEDVNGNKSVSVVTVTKVDTVEPTIELDNVGTDKPVKQKEITVTANDNSGQMQSLQYQWSTSNEEVVESDWKTISSESKVQTPLDENGTYYLHIKAIDVSGNISTYVSNSFELDNTVPVNPLMELSTTDWVNETAGVTLNIDYPSDATQKLYSTDQETWHEYIDGIKITSNQSVYSKAIDEAGNESDTSIVNISNIDDTLPTISTSINGSDTPIKQGEVTITAADTNSGMESLKYQWSTSQDNLVDAAWETITLTNTVSTPENANGNYYLHVKAVDKVGHTKEWVSNVFILDNTAPVPTPSTPGNSGGTVGEEIKHASVELDKLENGYQWTITNPKETTYELEADGIKFTLPLELNATEWVIKWATIENGTYQLSIIADGKSISTLKQPIKMTFKHNTAKYLLRSLGEAKYGPMPYVYSNQQFTFDIKKTGEFYFSSNDVTFTDITNVFSREAIEQLASRHIVVGTGDAKYSPYANITRGQMAGMIVNALELEATKKNQFTDTKGEWFEEKVQALYEAGITTGTTDTTFSPYDSITRQQASVMLLRILELSKGDIQYSQPSFKDNAQIADYAKEAVGTLQKLGIVNGKEGQIFDPNGKLTRAQLAQMLVKTLKYSGQF
ncbi:TPA: S-layer homology domain-containing protein [Salmonella enterica subsp. enterica serovar Typhi str. AG3]|nr:S-layer homology domain-containing protein [Salmonella enterica subsp. enterica serovar Typhi str. AG3]